MDLLPTFARLADARFEPDRAIDGRDIWPILSSAPGARTPRRAFYYYDGDRLDAVRSGPWKLFLARPAGSGDRAGSESTAARLFNLEKDLAETSNVAIEHPGVVRRLSMLAEEARRTLGDGDHDGSGQRPAGRVEEPTPRT